MLAQVMLVMERGRQGLQFVNQSGRVIRHSSQRFENDGIVCRHRYIRPPAERSMAANENAGNISGVEFFKRPANRCAGIFLVVSGDLLRRKVRGHWNGPVEIIGMRRSQTWNWTASLRPGSRKFRVRMSDTANAGKVPVKFHVRRQIG